MKQSKNIVSDSFAVDTTLINKLVVEELDSYPVHITERDGIYYSNFDDFQGTLFTEGNSFADVMKKSKEILEDMIYIYQSKGLSIPKSYSHFDENNKGKVAEISVWTKRLIDKSNSRIVRKNTTIPNWLAVEADKAGINYSETLQYALKKELGII
ncbi:hypothetical protein [Streptococcus pluranimalium]|uniref:hypothetical protein n=1 Tax=Streptococcus pluranimalium TaxID=82348 RepID=UPI003F6773C7